MRPQKHAGVAHVVERNSEKIEVTGARPVSGTKIIHIDSELDTGYNKLNILSSVYMTKKETAINLRKKGKTCGEIITILNVPKSTVWSWIKNLVLSKKIKKQILEKSRQKSRKNIIDYNTKVRPIEAARIRNKWIKKASKEIKNISKNNLKFIGSSLYWAEGGSKNRNSLRFGNSNPLIIKTIIKFFREICNIPDKKIGARIHLYPKTNQKKATNYWVEITNLPKINFYPPQTQISRASKGRRLKNTLPYGTLHLTINNTEMTCRVKGWIQGISEKINAGVVHW